MKSLKERLADKKAKEEKAAKKLSSHVRCFTVRLPKYGFPGLIRDSDFKFYREKAKALVRKIVLNADGRMLDFIEEAIKEHKDALKAKPKTSIANWWDWTPSIQAIPATEATPPSVPEQIVGDLTPEQEDAIIQPEADDFDGNSVLERIERGEAVGDEELPAPTPRTVDTDGRLTIPMDYRYGSNIRVGYPYANIGDSIRRRRRNIRRN